ncbi:MAG TPA: hypothetical protein PKD75_00855 [Tepidiformaceae bacterium]|nr:hypothetical protein [Tepidiformaceae bacterium]
MNHDRELSATIGTTRALRRLKPGAWPDELAFQPPGAPGGNLGRDREDRRGIGT